MKNGGFSRHAKVTAPSKRFPITDYSPTERFGKYCGVHGD
jgi:hypothetical protein